MVLSLANEKLEQSLFIPYFHLSRSFLIFLGSFSRTRFAICPIQGDQNMTRCLTPLSVSILAALSLISLSSFSRPALRDVCSTYEC
jgi:hypothetical protein